MTEKSIKDHLENARFYSRDARHHYRKAGHALKQLKKLIAPKPWDAYVREEFNISAERADELIHNAVRRPSESTKP
jgi:hypothetical protein